jgi:PadR family transcriptional regulator PadR
MGTDSNGRLSQFRKGAVELAILALLRRGEVYGGEIVDRLGIYPGLAISAGTVYPLLSRLKKSDLIDSSWRESPMGPPRKYYRLTAAGRAELAAMSGAWQDVSAAMRGLLAKGGSNESAE